MALIKTDEEIEILKEGGLILSRALGEALKAAAPGKTIAELDKIAYDSLIKDGAKPSFLNYSAGGDTPFPSTMCISRNEEVVHGLGNRDLVLKDGDIVGFDIGCWYKDLATDMAMTIGIGGVSSELRTLMNVTKASLEKGIAAAVAGKPLQSISQAIENTILPHDFGIVRSYTGHGVGHQVHEEPMIPNYVSDRFDNPILKKGMVLALEPMVTLGDEELDVADDNWAAITKDGSMTAHFEKTIVITETGAEVITPFPEI